MRSSFVNARCGPWKDAARQPAFTLVELVVVVLTLSLLAGLFLPALAGSGDNGRRTACANNLRQLGTATAMYANDNLDYLAFPNWDGGSSSLGPGWLYAVTNATIPDPGPGGPYATNPVAAYATGLWYRYTTNPKVYLCPADIESPTYQKPYPQGGRHNRMSSYVMNGAVCGYSATYRSCKITDAWNPASYLLWEPDENSLGPGNPGAFEFIDGANFPRTADGESVGRLHSANGAEILSVGGAVQFVTVRKFQAESLSPGRSLTWWSPYSINGQ